MRYALQASSAPLMMHSQPAHPVKGPVTTAAPMPASPNLDSRGKQQDSGVRVIPTCPNCSTYHCSFSSIPLPVLQCPTMALMLEHCHSDDLDLQAASVLLLSAKK